MDTLKIIGIALAIFLLPAIIFTFIAPKKIGEKIDKATENMKAKIK